MTGIQAIARRAFAGHLAGAAVICQLLGAPVQGQCHYLVTVLPTNNCGILGLDGGTPTALNDFGQVAGWHSQCFGDYYEAFAWNGGQTIGTIQRPANITGARALDINNVLGPNGIGQVCGELTTATQYLPFLWQNQQWQILPLGALVSPAGAYATNDNSLVVGYTTSGEYWIATYWHNGRIHTLKLPYGPRSIAAAVDSTGTRIVGWMGTYGLDSRAFLWENGVVTDIGTIPNGVSSGAAGINRRKQIVVGGCTDQSQPPGCVSRVYLWEAGNWTDLGMLPGYDRIGAWAINDRSEIVGVCWYYTPAGQLNQTAWVWRNGVMSDLRALVLPGSGILPGIGAARAINNEGQIVAVGGMMAGQVPYNVTVILTPVPDRAGDTNCDGAVDVNDLLNVINAWGPCQQNFCSTDLDHDGAIDRDDLITVILNWG